MAIPLYKGSGAFTAGSAAITVPFPTANPALPEPGDIALLVVTSENQAIALTTPNGFVEIPNSPQFTGTGGAAGSTRMSVFWKRCVGGGGDASPVVTDPGDHACGQIHLFAKCVETGDPWDVIGAGVDATSDTSGSIPGATTTVNKCLVVLLAATSNNATSTSNFSAWTNADLSNVTERTDNSNTIGLGSGHGLATGEKPTAGAYGATAVTYGAASLKALFSIALKGRPTVLIDYLQLETPWHIGPFKDANGNLYYFAEWSETANWVQALKSTDDGVTWEECDTHNRPTIRDFEGVGFHQTTGKIHMFHQPSATKAYNTFHTSDNATTPDKWVIRDENPGTESGTPLLQCCDGRVRSDGTVVFFWAGPADQRIHYGIRSAAGVWGTPIAFDDTINCTGVTVEIGSNDTIHIVYKRHDTTTSKACYRTLSSANVLSAVTVIGDVNTSTARDAPFVPIVRYVDGGNEVIAVGFLTNSPLDRMMITRSVNGGSWSTPVQMSDRDVAGASYDSDQPAAMMFRLSGKMYLFFSDKTSFDLYWTEETSPGVWATSTLLHGSITCGWVRGEVDGTRFLYVYDSISTGLSNDGGLVFDIFEPASGPQQFQQSVSGALGTGQLSGIAMKEARKLLTGGLDSARMGGATLKQVNKPVSAGLGTAQMAADLTPLKITLVSIGGTLDSARMAGTIQKEIRKITVGGLGAGQMAGVTIKQVRKAPTGTLDSARMAGNVSPIKTILKEVQGGLGPAQMQGVVTQRTNKLLTGATQLAGDLLRQVRKLLTGALDSARMAGVVARVKQARKDVTGSLGVAQTSGAVSRRVLKLLTGSNQSSGEVAKRLTKSTSGSLGAGQMAGVITTLKVFLRNATGGLGPAQMSGVVATLKKLGFGATGNLGPTQTQGTLSRLVRKGLTGDVQATGGLQRRVHKLLEGAPVAEGIVSRLSRREVAGILTMQGTVTRVFQTRVFVEGSVNFSGLLDAVKLVIVDILPLYFEARLYRAIGLETDLRRAVEMDFELRKKNP